MPPTVWTLWRRPEDADEGEPWEAFAGVKGTKHDARQAIEMCDLIGSFVDYEYAVTPEGVRPGGRRRF